VRIAGWILCGLVCALIGCGPPRGARHISNPDPSVKIPAIKVIVKDKDWAAIPSLVKNLSSDDPAVRFYAIEGLQRMTGQTFDYRYYAREEDRAAAIDRWNEWVEAHRPR
jgi:hypothetical protein